MINQEKVEYNNQKESSGTSLLKSHDHQLDFLYPYVCTYACIMFSIIH